MPTAIDTNTLLDILVADRFAPDSLAARKSVQASGWTVVCAVVFAELASYFLRRRDTPPGATVDSFLVDVGVELDGFGTSSLIQAGEAWAAYSRNRTRLLTCGSCGTQWKPDCPECHAPAPMRQHLAADFFIGAHASRQAAALLTRDLGCYRKDFDGLRLIELRHDH